jgi:hypothetical protein
MADWRYTPHGRLVHALSLGNAGAACGVTVLPAEEWRGTGSQDEYERAAQLPPCPRCVARVGVPTP